MLKEVQKGDMGNLVCKKKGLTQKPIQCPHNINQKAFERHPRLATTSNTPLPFDAYLLLLTTQPEGPLQRCYVQRTPYLPIAPPPKHPEHERGHELIARAHLLTTLWDCLISSTPCNEQRHAQTEPVCFCYPLIGSAAEVTQI